ncbi:nuclear transport factor 2 family protein [Arthrobacter sp. I2-34]|uniref:Nuclear transport factor 2 family protein n=1 Tax=Arthrobacter hankyongi TaxID=2904801 RepID=A0ABS9LCF2_9MICC|nr:nuclear transport factor 2 family protein [Arthrobacter hankyongi]MCG2624357.1 nuclear transport factor 2 family protein [Arthrobacter hankyongi]
MPGSTPAETAVTGTGSRPAASPRPRTTVAGLEARLRILEAADSVRWVMGRYFQLCDVPNPQLDLGELGSLFEPDAVWEGAGRDYADKFGRHTGREAIVAMLAGYLPPSEHFTANAHVLGDGRINVTGSTANGTWVMQQLSVHADGRRELLAARLNVDFALDGALATIRRFRTERLFAAPLDDAPAPNKGGARAPHPLTAAP